MTTAEFMVWVRREHHDLLVDRMASVLDRAADRARQAAGKHTCSCGCGQKCSPEYERKAAEHSPHWRRIEWEHRHKSVDQAGRFSAYASVWGDVDGPGDCVGDVVCKGAFRDCAGGSVPLVWQHIRQEPIGRARELREDSYGLRFVGQLELESPRAREAHAFLKNGGLDAFSIGYKILEYEDLPNGVRMLKRLDLHEISVVTMACDRSARMVQ
jgi:HK97 family phage prohead protease